MSEQGQRGVGPGPGQVDLEAVRRRGCQAHELDALLAVVDAARELRDKLENWEATPKLDAALEPFTPAEEPAYVRYVKTYRASLDEGGLEFNERMQERERARVLADLGIEVVPVGAQAAAEDAPGEVAALVRERVRMHEQRQRAERVEQEREAALKELSEAQRERDENERLGNEWGEEAAAWMLRAKAAEARLVEPQAAEHDEPDAAVSDAVSSCAGGRSSLTGGDLPHISPSGPAPPVDERDALIRELVAIHEQRQRERAEQAELDRDHGHRLLQVERYDREQVEQERDVARRGMKAVSARLARVPALVEAARPMSRLPFPVSSDERDQWRGHQADLVKALAEWEQA